MTGRMTLGQEFVRELPSPLACYEFTVLRILSYVIEDWTTVPLGETAIPEMRSLAPTRE